MHNLKFVLYSKPRCPQCQITKKFLDDNGLPYSYNYYDNVMEDNEVDIFSSNEAKRVWSEKKIEKLKSKYNVTSMPVVKVIDKDNNLIDHWSGFRVDKLQKYKREMQ